MATPGPVFVKSSFLNSPIVGGGTPHSESQIQFQSAMSFGSGEASENLRTPGMTEALGLGTMIQIAGALRGRQPITTPEQPPAIQISQPTFEMFITPAGPKVQEKNLSDREISEILRGMTAVEEEILGSWFRLTVRDSSTTAVTGLIKDSITAYRKANERLKINPWDERAEATKRIKTAEILLLQRTLDVREGKPKPTDEVPVPAHIKNLLKSVFPEGFDFESLSYKKGVPFYQDKDTAITLGTTMRIPDSGWGNGKFDTAAAAELAAHELYHAYQWRAHTGGQVAWYVGYILQAIEGKHRNHPLEIPAYKFSDEFGKALDRALKAAEFKDLKDAVDPLLGDLHKRFLREWEKEIPALQKLFKK